MRKLIVSVTDSISLIGNGSKSSKVYQKLCGIKPIKPVESSLKAVMRENCIAEFDHRVNIAEIVPSISAVDARTYARVASCVHGIRNENLVRAKLQLEIKPCRSYSIERENYTLRGIVDGITADGENVIEIKSRIRKTGLSARDILQANLYMYITGIPSCIFVESLNDSLTIETLKYDTEYLAPKLAKLDDVMAEILVVT